MGFSLEQLDQRLASRADEAPDRSYTAQLLKTGVEKCAQKLGEEAVETVIAAITGDKEHIIAESGDLLYHLLVLLRASDVPLSDIMAELERRTARSGLEEKAARSPGHGK